MSSMYQSFTELGAGDEDPLSLHVLPSSRSSRPWQHYIHDLDYFFLRVYRYHRRHGLLCIVLNQCLELIQFVFVVVFTIFLIHGVNYDVMFKNGPYKPTANNTKVTIGQTLIPWTEFQLSGIEIFLLIFATVFWIFKCLKMMQSFAVNSAIKSFYKEALKIQDCTLYTWQAVQSKLIAAQRLCLIQDSHLNELDVHNRILRHRNYLIALINKGLIPLHYRVPLIGEMTYLSKGLLFNMEYLLFKGPLSLFECNWKLKDEVKSQSNRIAIANQLARNCLYLAAANLVLFPFVAVWQLLTTFFMYAESLKRDPSMVLGPRTWSLYARWYCRHFNELDHQLDDRLNRGYKDATKYMNSFTSPAVEIIARHVTFFAASILAVLICLTVYDEDVITVEHLITVMTALGAIIAVSRAFISPEIPFKYTQVDLYTQILEHLHYMPAGYAPYSTQAQNAMAKVFQYKMMGILEELVSPIVTPYILAKHLRGRSLELVDFFRNFTVNVQGTGDVCAFAMLNIKDNGNSAWKPSDSVDTTDGHSAELHLPPLGTGPPEMEMVNLKLGHVPDMNASQVPQSLLCTENGKLELSLIHFKLTNPDWIPSEGGQQKFIDFVTSNAIKEDVEPETASTSEAEPSTTSAMRQSMRRSLHPNVESVTRDENELFSLSRERVRVINGEHPSSISSRLNSNLQMTLSTLFLHEYAATHSTTGHSAVPVTENDPLLLSANRPRTSYS